MADELMAGLGDQNSLLHMRAADLRLVEYGHPGLDDDYQFHRDLIDFLGNEIMSEHYRLNVARLRFFRINIGEPLARVEVATREHLDILDACAERNPELAAARLARHIEVSRQHTLGLRPIRWTGHAEAQRSP